MVNEQDLGWNYRQPIGQPQGMAVAPKKQAGLLLKNIMARAKPKQPQQKARTKGRMKMPRKKWGLEADSKVHFGGNAKFW